MVNFRQSNVKLLLNFIDHILKKLQIFNVPRFFRRLYFYCHASHCETCTVDCWVKSFSPPYPSYFIYWKQDGYPIRWIPKAVLTHQSKHG